ncbi:uncharacterized protein LOC132476987 [Mesoplodon densirostris]|uniref:uncharacterized protein LOC132476987 n=1 Tax=Mesoplodon densirostris TaxID=48708 RepID=UPI0028DCF4CB|nr:uncharacterized protein LOC132476987 [Mesoplodon densirostris]
MESDTPAHPSQSRLLGRGGRAGSATHWWLAGRHILPLPLSRSQRSQLGVCLQHRTDCKGLVSQQLWRPSSRPPPPRRARRQGIHLETALVPPSLSEQGLRRPCQPKSSIRTGKEDQTCPPSRSCSCPCPRETRSPRISLKLHLFRETRQHDQERLAPFVAQHLLLLLHMLSPQGKKPRLLGLPASFPGPREAPGLEARKQHPLPPTSTGLRKLGSQLQLGRAPAGGCLSTYHDTHTLPRCRQPCWDPWAGRGCHRGTCQGSGTSP